MGNFRSNSRGGFRDRSSGSRFGGRSSGFGNRNRFDGGRDSGRRSSEMHDAICNKCGKNCQIPFRPTGDKPIFCSDCFRKNEGSNSNFGSRNQERSPQSGMSSEQFKQINSKLDKILLFLQNLEIETEEDMDDDLDEDSEDEDSEND